MTLFSQVMTAVCAGVPTHAMVSPLHYPPTSLVWPLNLSMISVGSLDTCGAECGTCPVSRACNSGGCSEQTRQLATLGNQTLQDIGGNKSCYE